MLDIQRILLGYGNRRYIALVAMSLLLCPFLKKGQGRDENEVSEGTYLCEKASLEQAWKAYDGAIRLDHVGTAEAREKETAQLSQASELFREAGSNFDAAQVLYEEAKVYLGLHDANNALECSGRAIELAEGFKSEEAEARVRMLEGQVYSLEGYILLTTGRPLAAQHCYSKVLSTSFLPEERVQALENIGITYDSIGEKRLAIDLYRVANLSFDRVSDPVGRARMQERLGLDLLSIGEFHESSDVLSAAASLYKTAQDLADSDRVAKYSAEALASEDKADTYKKPNLIVQVGHSGQITSIRFSSDGKYLLTAGDDHTMRLWSVDTGDEIRGYRGHSAGIESVDFSRDGRSLLSCDSRSCIKIWDRDTGNIIREFQGDPIEACSIASCPDGLSFAAATTFSAKLWNIDTGEEMWKISAPPGQRINDLVFSPDGRFGFIATGLLHSGKSLSGSHSEAPIPPGIIAFDTESGVQRWRTNLYESEVGHLAISNDGTRIAADGLGADYVTVLEASTGNELHRLIHKPLWRSTPIQCSAISSSANLVASADVDGRIKLWNLETGLELKELRDPTGQVSSIAFSPDGAYLAVGALRSVYLFDTRSGTRIREFNGRALNTNAISFSPDGSLIASANEAFDDSEKPDVNAYICIWDLVRGAEVDRCVNRGNTLNSLAFSSDSRRLLTGHRNPTLWSLNPLTEIREFRVADSWQQVKGLIVPGCLALSPDDKYVLIGDAPIIGGTSFARLLDCTAGNELRRVEHLWPIGSVGFTSDARLAFSSSSGKVLTEKGTVESHAGQTLVWETSTGKVIQSLKGFPAAFSSSGEMLLVGQEDESAPCQIWNILSGKLVCGLPSGSHGVQSLCFSQDGTRVAIGSRDGSVRIWNVPDAKLNLNLYAPANEARSVSFSPDGRMLLTLHGDNIARLWTSDTGKKLCDLISLKDSCWAIIDPEGRFDTNDLEGIQGLKWIFTDEPLKPLPLDLFIRQYYEPGLLSKVLSGTVLSPVPALSSLNRMQPLIQIRDIKPGPNDTVSVDVEVIEYQYNINPALRDNSAYDLRLFRAGQLVGQDPEPKTETEESLKNGVQLTVEQLQAWRDARRLLLDTRTGKGERTFMVRLPHGQAGKEIEFTAYAFNGDRVKSETATARYKLPLDAGPVKRRAYVVTMGVNAYENPGWDLRFAASDAKRMQKALSSRLEKQQYEVVPVTLISDYRMTAGVRQVTEDHATREGLHAVLELLAGHTLSEELKKNLPPGAEKIDKAEPDDLVMLTVSSHGYTSKEGLFYIVPSNSGETTGRGFTAELRKKWISSDELSAWLRDVDAGDLVMIVDTCHSAATVNEPGFKPGPMGSRGLGQLAYDKGMRILAASQADDVALESEKLKQGLLTYALVHDGLEAKQAVKTGTNEITLDSWLEYGSQRVPPLYQELVKGRIQTFTEGSRDVHIDEELSGQSSSLKKPSAFQQPRLFNFQKNKQDVLLQ